MGRKLKKSGWILILAFLALVLIFPQKGFSEDNGTEESMTGKQESLQPVKVEGRVSDEQGIPMPGVAVVIKGTTKGTATNIDGEYELELANLSGTLIFSFVGMERKEVQIEGRAVIDISMIPESQQIEEVVATGYQKINRRMFTGSAEVVSAENVKVDGAADISRSLQGKAAGVQMTNVSGTFGAAPKLRVRGASSIYGSSNPLWVVDGVILDEMVNVSASDLSSGNAVTLISSAVAGLNADDIESFQILKDASATALYGAKAMNGVIVITTKKGNKGVTSLNYTSEFTVRLTPTYSQYDILNSQEQMSVYLEMEEKGLLNPASLYLAKDGGVFSQWYQMTDERDENGNYLADNTNEAKFKYLQRAEYRNTNWFKELFRPSIQQNHSISISSGTDKSSNYLSLSYFNDPGWTESNKVDRYTFNANTTYQISPKITFGVQGNASVRMQKAPGTLNQEVDVVEGKYTRDFDINPFNYVLNTSRTMDADTYYRRNYADFSMENELDKNYLQLDMMDTKVQVNLSYKPIKELEISGVGSFRYAKSTREHRILNGSNMAEAYRAAESTLVIEDNNFLWEDPNNPDALPLVVLDKGGFYNTQDNNLKSYYARGSANYNKIIDGIHAINFLAGAELGATDRLARFNNGYGYLWGSDLAVTDYRIIQKVIDAGNNYFGMSETFERHVGFFGTGTYSYRGLYTINGTLRTEGTNQMGKSNTARWLPTWNISGSWNVKNEPFMKDIDFISTLSFRATYGLTAKMSPNVNAAAVYNAATTYRPFQDDRETALYISSLANEDLTWEKMKETNIGVDFGLLKNRISLSLDSYWRNSFDLIGRIRTTGIGGEHIKYANMADMESSGVEFTLNTVNVQKMGFKWASNFTFSYNTNKITNLKSTPRVIDLVGLTGTPKEGYSQSGLFSIPFAGLDENGFPTFYNKDGESTYYIYFQDTETEFLKYEGQIDPKYIGGLENFFEYKNFTFSLFFTYQGGNVIRLYPAYNSRYSDTDAMTKDMRNRWIMPGDEKYTTVPTIASAYQLEQNSDLTYAYSAYNFSTERVAKGDFVRLKDITLSYKFNKSIAQKLGVKSLQVKGTASNVWLIYSDKKLNGQDPEFSRSGGVAMPTPHQFTFSVRVGL